ncbi:ferredoxin family protein [Gluconacetobacter aggeris]|uniref:Ferredoxin family protein n=1 Tax=Gluconacetobacter aggeris TaxID=1286186 RepID=A0A7W4ISP5_9PROT|nr:ferredoxin family protein [Gluconacetobacter aggeris]MBB2168062.1 ferredoxin family protein [Gluconacetobacter aggeris]
MIEDIFPERCTGCNDCVTVCPDHVLDPGAAGAPPVIARVAQCQTCFLCELYCAHDAIYVAVEGAGTGTTLHHPTPLIGRLRHDYGWDGSTDDPLRAFWQLGPLLREGLEISAARHTRRQATALSEAATGQEGDEALSSRALGTTPKDPAA